MIPFGSDTTGPGSKYLESGQMTSSHERNVTLKDCQWKPLVSETCENNGSHGIRGPGAARLRLLSFHGSLAPPVYPGCMTPPAEGPGCAAAAYDRMKAWAIGAGRPKAHRRATPRHSVSHDQPGRGPPGGLVTDQPEPRPEC